MTDSTDNTPHNPDNSAPENTAPELSAPDDAPQRDAAQHDVAPTSVNDTPADISNSAEPISRKPEPLYNAGQPAAPSTPSFTAPATPAPATPAPATPAPAVPAAAVPGPHTASAPHPAPAAPPSAAAGHHAEPGASFTRRAPLALVAAFAAVALVGGVSGAGVTFFALSQNGGNSSQVSAQPANITVNDANNATTVTAVAAKASPSVVTISTTGKSAAGTGSGVVIDDQGHILTNTHVVTLDGAAANATVSVQTTDGRLLKATVVGTDPISDLAVIKVDAAAKLPAIAFADSGKLNVGDAAIAIGAPLGLTTTVTNGIISALNRSITIASSAVPQEPDTKPAPGDKSSENPFDFWQFDVPGDGNKAPTASSGTIQLTVIQTDAAINPGNSGGALLDADGDIIGINVAIASSGGGSSAAAGNIGVGFAIPANLAKRVAAEIIANGSATHGLLGASILDVTEDTGATNALTVGASVKEVVAGGAAANGGLKVGDVITGINGLPITGKNDLTAQVRSLAAGAKATITYLRGGKSYTLDVTLGKL
ncbi:MAG: S1C family serine protease [Microbacteriaceae bacterium]